MNILSNEDIVKIEVIVSDFKSGKCDLDESNDKFDKLCNTLPVSWSTTGHYLDVQCNDSKYWYGWDVKGTYKELL